MNANCSELSQRCYQSFLHFTASISLNETAFKSANKFARNSRQALRFPMPPISKSLHENMKLHQ